MLIPLVSLIGSKRPGVELRPAARHGTFRIPDIMFKHTHCPPASCKDSLRQRSVPRTPPATASVGPRRSERPPGGSGGIVPRRACQEPRLPQAVKARADQPSTHKRGVSTLRRLAGSVFGGHRRRGRYQACSTRPGSGVPYAGGRDRGV